MSLCLLCGGTIARGHDESVKHLEACLFRLTRTAEGIAENARRAEPLNREQLALGERATDEEVRIACTEILDGYHLRDTLLVKAMNGINAARAVILILREVEQRIAGAKSESVTFARSDTRGGGEGKGLAGATSNRMEPPCTT